MKYSLKNDEMLLTEFNAKNKNISYAENLYALADKSLVTRGRRALIRQLSLGEGLMGDDTLAYVDNGRLYYGGMEISGLYLTPGEKRILKVGKFLVIFPDEVFVNLENYDDCGTLNSTYFTYGSAISIVDINGNKLSYTVVTELPETASEGSYCMLKGPSGELTMKKMFKNGWQNTNAYIKIDAGGIGASFRAGDTVYATGLSNIVGNYFKIAKRTTNWLLLEGIIEKTGFSTGSVNLWRKIPSFDYATVSGGRLFGVRRGSDKDGNLVCRMYGSAIGDPFNFAPEGGGVVMDLDINGTFTGICDYLGSPVAFTETEVIEARVKGNSLIGTVIKGYGVQSGNEKSIAHHSGVLYYKSKAGVCIYDGSYPELISDENQAIGNTCGLALNGRYYLSDENGISVYDIKNKKWSRENGCSVTMFAECKGCLYALCKDSDGDFIVLMDFDSASDEQRYYLADEMYPIVEVAPGFVLESIEIGSDVLESVCPARIAFRIKNDGSTPLKATVIYHGGKEYSKSFTVSLNGTVEIPLPLRRCESFRVRIEGSGQVAITGMQVYYRVGGKARGWK